MGIKQISVGRSDLFQLKPQDIQVEAGFNARDFSKPEVQEHVRSLAEKIKNQGYDYSKPLKVRVVDNVALLRDGECRLRAVLSLIDGGIEIRAVPVIPVKASNNVDDLVEQVNANDGKRFDAFEEADVFKRLLSFGLAVSAIAARIGRNENYVTERLALGGADHDVRELVRDGALAVSAAREVIRLPVERKREIVRTAKKAKSEGRKVTVRETRIAARGHADSILFREIEALAARLRQELEGNHGDEALKHKIEGIELVLDLGREK